MAKVRPFKAVRPDASKVRWVASRSYISYDKEDLIAKLTNNPYSFIHIINPEYNEIEQSPPNSIERFEKVRAKYDEFLDNGIFNKEEEESFYLYEQKKNSRSYVGIIGGASVEDYENDIIKKHEQTLTSREVLFKNYLDLCHFNAEPVLLTYEDNPTINEIIDAVRANDPIYKFTSDNGEQHKVWRISQSKQISSIVDAFAEIEDIYIADGHHRSASSCLLGADRKFNNTQHKGQEPYNYYMSLFMAKSQLDIFDFNRLVKDLNGLSEEVFLEMLEHDFNVTLKGTNVVKPSKQHQIGMYFNNLWYELEAKKNSFDANHAVKSLDAHILSENILEPILGISDLKTDNRVAFESGVEGYDKLISRVDSGEMTVAFTLYPVTFEELKAVSDDKEIMPPKTTWIEPKLRSGLLIYEIDDK